MNGLPVFYLRDDEEIMDEIMNSTDAFGLSFEYNNQHYIPHEVFKLHGADPRDKNLIPPNFRHRCWIVWHRISRLCRIKTYQEKFILWGLTAYEATALANLEFQIEQRLRSDSTNMRGLSEKEIANLSIDEISVCCNVNITRAEEISKIFQPLQGKFIFDYYDEESPEKMDWLENSYRPWKSEMKKKTYLANIPPIYYEYAKKSHAWAISLGLGKITNPEFKLLLFELEINLIDSDRKHVLKMANELF